MSDISIATRKKSFDITLQLPGSKSITNRALIMAALCDAPSTLHNVLDSDDTEACRRALENLKTSKRIDCRDAGTVARFLLPVCAVLGGEYYVDGSQRMRERPLAELLKILQLQNISFEFLNKTNQMPFIMRSQGLAGGKVEVDISDSSQFLSGLLLAAPLTKCGMTIHSSASIARKPYVQMTLKLMQKFGVLHKLLDEFTIKILPQHYQATTLTIEPDASTASYFFAAAVLTKSSVNIPGLNADSLQGDLKFLTILEKIGCTIHYGNDCIQVTGTKILQSIGEIDMSSFSDTFMTLAIIAPFLPTPTTIKGLRHTRLQESDRVAAMQAGLKNLGIKTEATEDSLTIFPGTPHGGIIDSYQDHRIAMSFAILGLIVPGIIIERAECVSKTCPDFFQLLRQLGE